MNLRFQQPFAGRDQLRFRSTTARQTSSCGTITVTEDGGGDGGGGDNGDTQPGPGDGGGGDNGDTQPGPGDGGGPVESGFGTVALAGGAVLLLLILFLLMQ